MKQTFFVLIFLGLLVRDGAGQVRGYLQMYVSGPVHYVVKDSKGRKAGIDPRSGKHYSEIPNAGYGLGGADSHDEDTEPIEYWEFGFNTVIEDPFFRDSYEVEVIGVKKGIFDGMISMTQSDHRLSAIDTIRGLIDINQAIRFLISYSTDTTVVPTFSKIVEATTLRQDLKNSFELNLLGDKTLYNDLVRRVDTYDRHLAGQDSSKARHTLEKLSKKIDETFRKTEKPGPDQKKNLKRFILEDAYWVLNQDVLVLLDHLPEKRWGDRENDDEDENENDRDDDDE